ncbi:DedD protein [Oceanimonas sp. GK1]|uniref:cell division protein DedD n=1 Tax=Oceanimonas sp. (strain GK1 / IBRC-M 10197) TaxID=511062 RepID=UPI0002494E5A|nr:cell division protein DedD [Oceanimonas sp. GK1]AEY02121.1 DedD protein [Oceanimonas sp. GK1]
MATQFQHRLVGTILLVALGVIFLPDLLDGKQPPLPDQAVSIPLRPELEPVRPPVPAAPADAPKAETWTLEEVKEAPSVPPASQPPVASAPEPAPVVAPAPTPGPVRPAPEVKPVAPKPAPAPAPKPAPVVQPAGGHFIVQLGAFRNADNVNALVRKLQAAGYRVQTTPSVPRQGELNRVWIGPDAKSRLEQQLPALERLTGLKGRVMAQ